MNFECFVCYEKFANENITIKHLQQQHKYKDHTTELKCLVNFAFCGKKFLTYSGLRKHLKSCSKKQYGDAVIFEVILQNGIYLCATNIIMDEELHFSNRLHQLKSVTRRRKP